jgi:hypothetical protein
MLAVGDVILGVGGKPFASDPRVEFGRALTAAESERGGGKLRLTRWRKGSTGEVVVKLPVLGSYSPTAPSPVKNPGASSNWLARRWPSAWPRRITAAA